MCRQGPLGFRPPVALTLYAERPSRNINGLLEYLFRNKAVGQ